MKVSKSRHSGGKIFRVDWFSRQHFLMLRSSWWKSEEQGIEVLSIPSGDINSINRIVGQQILIFLSRFVFSAFQWGYFARVLCKNAFM